MNKTLIRDALYCTSPHSAASIDLGHGIVTGIATTLMAANDGMLLAEAFEIVVGLLPSDYRFACIPEAWRDLVPDVVLAKFACRKCGERRLDQLILGEDELEGYVRCKSCGVGYKLD